MLKQGELNMQSIDRSHSSKRTVLRIAGPILLLIGLLFMFVGFIDFFIAMSGFGHPKLFWCFFVGGPFLFIGTTLSIFGFMGGVARYSAGEMAPVAKDTFNYMAEGTQEGIQTVASAIGTGLSEGLKSHSWEEPGIRCPKCNAVTEEDNRFCPDCGASMVKTSACSHCGELNDADARFCDNCGRALAQQP
jgi:RNA polymerase subunit RPABC4/transcription elongation factor Spt4